MSFHKDLLDLAGTGASIYALSQLGRGPTPSAGQTTGQAFQAYRDYYPTKTEEELAAGAEPGYAQIMRSEQEQDLAHQLQLTQQYAQPAAEQQLAMAKEFIPQYGQLAGDEAYRERMRDAGASVDVLRGPGGMLIDEAFMKARQVDKPFYDQRDAAGQRLGDLLASFADPRTLKGGDMYDPERPGGRFTGALSGSEEEMIQRSLGRQGAQTGALTGPRSMQDVVANAMTFGQGVQNRRDALGRALGTATSFLPASRSGFDPLQVALGRPSQQFGAQQFSQPSMATNTAAQSGGFLGNTFGAAQQSAGFRANAPTWLDRVGQGVDVMRDIGSGGW